jgi:hypothetical protein
MLAYGSLRWDPGHLADVLDLNARAEWVETPFPIEFARSSTGTRGGGPSLIPVDNGGARVSAPVVPFRDRMSVQEAQTLIWRREVRATEGEYNPLRSPGPNKVYVDEHQGISDAFDVVLAVRIGANITPLTADVLAACAIRSAQSEAGAARRDGISYLIEAKRCGVETPLSPAYEAAVLGALGVASLEEALLAARARSG